jgi:hypothetical protein
LLATMHILINKNLLTLNFIKLKYKKILSSRSPDKIKVLITEGWFENKKEAAGNNTASI